MVGVAERRFDQLQVRSFRVDVGAQVARLLQRGLVGRLLRLQHRVRVVHLLLGKELLPIELGRAAERLARQLELGRGTLHVGRRFDGRQGHRQISDAVARHGPAQRGALLVEPILQLLGIEHDEGLARRDAVPEVRRDAEDPPFDLRRNRHLFVGRERAHDVDGPAEFVRFDVGDGDGQGRRLRRRAGRRRAAAGDRGRRRGDDHHVQQPGNPHEQLTPARAYLVRVGAGKRRRNPVPALIGSPSRWPPRARPARSRRPGPARPSDRRWRPNSR